MRRKNSEAFKQEVLQKGMDLMWLKGYNGTSVKDIVDVAGIPKGSFYNYFDSKEDFAIEALNAFIEQGIERFLPILQDASLSPLIRIRKFYKAHIDILEMEMECKKGCFVSNLAQEMADVNDKLALVAQKAFKRMKKPIVQVVKEAIAVGELNASINPEDYVDFIDNSFRGAMVQMKASHSVKPVKLAYQFIAEKFLT